jgi:hypothetical protein
MRRVDHRVDALARDVGRQALGAAEAADALRDRRRLRPGGYARKGQGRRNIRLIGDPPRERVRFRRSAENEQAKAVQRAAP